MIEAAVFDLDDTLISLRQYSLACLRHVARTVAEEHRDIDKEQFFFSLQERYDEGARSTLLDDTLEQYSLFSAAYRDRLVSVYRSTSIADDAVFGGSREVLEKLVRMNIRLFLVTDGNVERQRCKVRNLGFGGSFERMLFTQENGDDQRKPCAAAHESAVREAGIDPGAALAVGDNPYRDFVGVRELGFKTVRIRRKDGRFSHVTLDRRFEADREIETLKDIFHHLEGTHVS